MATPCRLRCSLPLHAPFQLNSTQLRCLRCFECVCHSLFTMGRLFKAYLPGDKVWCCQSCAAHLAYQDDVMSRNFTGKHGRAFLVSNV